MYNKKSDKFQGQIKMALKEAIPDLDLTFTRLFQTLRIKSHLTGAGIRKCEGYSAVHLVLVMFTSVFLNLPGLCGCAHLNLTALTAAGKDAFYRLKNRDLSWRSFLWRFLCFVAQQLGWSQQAPTEAYFVLDTTVLPKRGEKIEEVSYVYDHCRGRSVLGYELLTLLMVNSQGYYPLDFEYHVSNKKGSAYQAATVSRRRSSLDRRRLQAQKNKFDVSLQMVQRALAKGVQALYVLVDRWFAAPQFFLNLRLLGVHGIGRLKAGKSRYLYQGREYNLEELYRLVKPNLSRYRALGYDLARLEVTCANGLPGIIVFSRGYREPEVKLPAGAKLPPQPKWAAFFTTDVSLAADEVVKKYLCRWSIEVFFKEAKTLLGLGKDQSRSFAAQVCATTLTFLRFNVLAFIKAQGDAAQTIGGLFRELAEEIGLINFQDRICAYFRQFLTATLKMLKRSLPVSASFCDVLDTIDIVINELDLSQGCET
jgi:hypothetical protein